MANAQTAPKGKNKGQVSPKLATPATLTNGPFAALVATQAKQANKAATVAASTAAQVTMPNAGVAVQQAAKAGFTRTVQNGRKDYTPNSIGALIWQTATSLQALTPATPITSAAVRLALPHIKATSVSCGLSHWRKFCGTMRVKGQTAAPATV